MWCSNHLEHGGCCPTHPVWPLDTYSKRKNVGPRSRDSYAYPGLNCSSNTPHIFYLHTEKTGGTAIECAVQPLVAQQRWTNLGHSTLSHLQHCRQRCGPPGASVVVISVRQPHMYYKSMWEYSRARCAPPL
jgi:hypothetical protein